MSHFLTNLQVQQAYLHCLRVPKGPILEKSAGLVSSSRARLAECDAVINRLREAIGERLLPQDDAIAAVTDSSLPWLQPTQQPAPSHSNAWPQVRLKVAMAAKCRNGHCKKTIIVAEGSEAPAGFSELERGFLDLIRDLAHSVVCSHCGHEQTFREFELRPLAS